MNTLGWRGEKTIVEPYLPVLLQHYDLPSTGILHNSQSRGPTFLGFDEIFSKNIYRPSGDHLGIPT